MKFKANFTEKPVNFQMDDCRIEKVVELSHEDFCRLKITPLADQPFIRENKGCMFHRDGIIHCLLALGQDEWKVCAILRDRGCWHGFRYSLQIPADTRHK